MTINTSARLCRPRWLMDMVSVEHITSVPSYSLAGGLSYHKLYIAGLLPHPGSTVLWQVFARWSDNAVQLASSLQPCSVCKLSKLDLSTTQRLCQGGAISLGHILQHR